MFKWNKFRSRQVMKWNGCFPKRNNYYLELEKGTISSLGIGGLEERIVDRETGLTC